MSSKNILQIDDLLYKQLKFINQNGFDGNMIFQNKISRQSLDSLLALGLIELSGQPKSKMVYDIEGHISQLGLKVLLKYESKIIAKNKENEKKFEEKKKEITNSLLPMFDKLDIDTQQRLLLQIVIEGLSAVEYKRESIEVVESLKQSI
ncbi:MAG: hypothetical protein U1C51_06730, partial [Candidatus Izemoplasmatales bacterium]|nr:hypothetical protein [Candidatus Izemoplasmatales bacterium]